MNRKIKVQSSWLNGKPYNGIVLSETAVKQAAEMMIGKPVVIGNPVPENDNLIGEVLEAHDDGFLTISVNADLPDNIRAALSIKIDSDDKGDDPQCRVVSNVLNVPIVGIKEE